MNFGVEQIITWGGMAIGLLGIWHRMQYKVERLEEKDTEQGRQIEAFWKWKDIHEKDASDKREIFQKEMSKLEGANLVVSEQFKRIMEILEDIKYRLGILEKRP